MQKLSPIPCAPSVLWQTIRLRIVPAVVFFAVVAVIATQWNELDGGGAVGIAEGIRSVVASPQPAVLKDLRVRPYQWVEAGQLLAVLQPMDPRARLDLLQSELQIARLRMEPSLADQNALDFERLRVESLRLKQELAVAEVELARATNALRRNALLRDDKLVSEDAYDLSLRDRDMYQAQITEQRKAIAEIERRLVALRPLGEPETQVTNHPWTAMVADLSRQKSDAQTGWDPVTLLAPISGMVQVLNHQPGEFLAEGEPLLSIHSATSDRIVGYLRQPYPVEPELGMKVEVVTRSRQRRKFQSEIAQIGAQVELITNALTYLKPFSVVDVGLPIVINVPLNVRIRPGEVLDIVFLPSPSGAVANRRADAGEPILSAVP